MQYPMRYHGREVVYPIVPPIEIGLWAWHLPPRFVLFAANRVAGWRCKELPYRPHGWR